MTLNMSRALLLMMLAAPMGCVELDAPDSANALRRAGTDAIPQPSSGLPLADNFQLCPHRFKVKARPSEQTQISERSRSQPYCATADLGSRRTFPGYTRVVFSQHGRTPDGEGYLNVMTNAAASVGMGAETFVISPHFLRYSDWMKSNNDKWPNGFDPTKQFFYGENTKSDWAIGGDSARSYNGQSIMSRSSFEIYDAFLDEVIAKFPDLTEVVIAGQSAGGQFTQRYAVSTSYAFPASLEVRFAPANPQSYLYLTACRPYFVDGDQNTTATNCPSSPQDAFVPWWQFCPWYDNYFTGVANLNGLPQGLGGLNPLTYSYMKDQDPMLMRQRYSARNVTYLVGQADTLPPESDFSCRMAMQGQHRLERAQKYAAYIQGLFGASNPPHRLQVVPAHGHGKGIFSKDCAKRWIFDIPKLCP